MSKVLITGLYDPTYPRNRSLINSFKQIGEVTEWPLRGRWWGGVKLAFYLTFSYRYKYVVVLQPAQFLLPFVYLLKFIPGRPKIVVDAFISMYDTIVSDRKLVTNGSIKSRIFQWLDRLIYRVGGGAFFDTLEHQQYFNFPSVWPQAVVPVVPDYDLLSNIKADKKLLKSDKVNILFYGKYIPLQGVATIIEVAKILQPENNFHFTLIGRGQDYAKVKSLTDSYKLENVTFYPRMSYSEIISALKSADMALGVFGEGEKMQRVIPNKVIEALAVGTPLITGESRAVERFFKNNEHLFLVPPANPEALVEKIKEVASDLPQAKQIALSGQAKAKQDFNEELVEKRLSELLARVE